MRKPLVLTLVVLLAIGASAGASLRLAPGKNGVQIPIDVRGNLIYMRGRIENSDSLWVVLDSGASNNAVNSSRAKSLGLEIARTSQARGAGGMVEGGVVNRTTVKLPGLTLENESIGTVPLDDVVLQSGRAMDVIVGHPLLRRCAVKIDYAAKLLTVWDGKAFKYSGNGTVLPLTFDHNLPYVTARVGIPGREPIEGRFVIDSGSTQALILAAPFVKEQKVLEALPRTIEGRGQGVGGMSQTRIGRLASLELGGIRLEQPIAALRTSGAGHIAAEGATGNIGGEILRRFTVIFDYPRNRMILEPNAQLADTFETDMAGFGLILDPQGSQAFRVEWMQDGPASEAGFQVGDLIEAVDGTPAGSIGIAAMRLMMRRPGAHRLAILRGDQKLEIALETRRLI